MSEQQPNSNKISGNSYTITFMVILSIVCAVILSIFASALAGPKEQAKELDRSKQMMIAARILSHNGYFLMKNDKGEYVPGKYGEDGTLVAGTNADIASSKQILDIYNNRLFPLLVDDKGATITFKQANININEYLADYKKIGFYKLPLKLVYKLLPNTKTGEKVDDPMKMPAEGWIIPLNGFGLWDAIYGYLALEPNADTIIGITWYEQKETPGLGANIAEESWQSLFPGKLIFQENADGTTNFKTGPLGITVVKGKVSEVYGNIPKAKSAVDGMAGATLTGNGVTDAFKNVLAPYRPFLIRIHDEHEKEHPTEGITKTPSTTKS